MKKLLIHILIIFCGCTMPLALAAQRLPFSFDQVRVGGDAISNQVNCMLKDSKGYFWLGTASGLKRYDPVYTASFRRKKNDSTSLLHNNIQDLCEDKQGRIWIATSEGVCYYNRKTNLFTQLPQTKHKGAVCENVICVSNGDVWFSLMGEGIYRYDIKTGHLQNFSPSAADGAKLSSKWVVPHGMVEDPRKKGLWIASYNGLNFFNYETGKIYNHQFNPGKVKILTEAYTSAPVIHQDKLVFSDNNFMQIKWYDVISNTITDSLRPVSGQGFPLFYVLQLFFDKNDNLWLSTTDQRAAYIDMKQRRATDIVYMSGRKNSFSSDKFTDVLQEKNNTLWFATANGLTTVVGFDAMSTSDKLFDVYDFSTQFFANGKEQDWFSSVTEDTATRKWWITTAGSRLIEYDPKTAVYSEWKAPPVKQCLNYDVTLSVHGYQNKILLFKAKAFFIFDKAGKQFSAINMPAQLADCENFLITHTLAAGDSVWVFVRSKVSEAYCYNLVTQKWSVYPFVKSRGGEEISPEFSCVTKKGELLVAVNGKGLAKLSKEKRQFEFIMPDKAGDYVGLNFTGLAEDNDGNILLGTKSELIKFYPATNEIKTIMETDLIGALAVSNTGHVCYASLDNVVFFDEKKDEKIGFQFEIQDVFHSQENKLITLSGGKIISLQKKQLMLLNFKEIDFPSFPDQLYINRVSTPDTSILINENNSRISFTALQNSFAIDFGMMGPPNTSIYEFSYQLEGFDKGWVPDTKAAHSAVYGNLDGGDYVFKVRATDLNGVVLPEQKLYIHIDTVFYKRKWFIGLLLALMAFSLFMFYRFRLNKHKQILSLESKAFTLEKEKTQVQYDNLKQQLNPHFLFNSLSSLRSLIRLNPPLATEFLDGLSKTYRYLLKSGDSELVTLKEEISFVETFVQLQKTRFEEGLELKINLPETIMNKKIAPVTIQNLIENAIKHNTIDDESPLVIEIMEAGEGYIAVRNNLQRHRFVETSNKKGLTALKTLYSYFSEMPLLVEEDEKYFTVKVPLI